MSLKAAAGAAPAQVPTAARATAYGLRAASASLAQGKGVRSFSEAAAPADGAFLCVRTLFSKAGVGVSDVSCRARSAALLHLKASACLDVQNRPAWSPSAFQQGPHNSSLFGFPSEGSRAVCWLGACMDQSCPVALF